MHKSVIIKQIETAFSGVEYPGNWCLKESSEGDEPNLLEMDFSGRNNWKIISSDFLDNAPDGYSSALSFFSIEAFRFYIPAYMIADINDELNKVDVVYYLTNGLFGVNMNEKINSRRYGERTWYDEMVYKMSVFDLEMCLSIKAYLTHCGEIDSNCKFDTTSAIINYWNTRIEHLKGQKSMI